MRVDTEGQKNGFDTFCSFMDLQNMHSSRQGMKLDPQPAIVRSDNKNSEADGLKAPHQLSQLPNYTWQEEVQIRGTPLYKERLGALIDLLCGGAKSARFATEKAKTVSELQPFSAVKITKAANTPEVLSVCSTI